MCGTGDDVETREYDLSGFTAVEAGSSFKIEIIQSNAFAVRVRAPRSMFRRLVVRASAGTLHLYRKFSFWPFPETSPEATIHMPVLDSIELNGAASARVPDFRNIGRLDMELAGAARLKGAIEAVSINVRATGASRLTLSGSAARATLDASGASELDLARFSAAEGSVELSGASRATVHFTDTIESLDVSGASRLRYLGDPRIKCTQSSGSSRVARVA
jgi:hypothetical protein